MDELLRFIADLCCVGEQLAGNAKIGKRSDLIAVGLKFINDRVDAVLESFLDAAGPEQVIEKWALLTTQPGCRVGSVAAQNFSDAVLNRLGAIGAGEVKVLEFRSEGRVFTLESGKVFNDRLRDIPLRRAQRPRRSDQAAGRRRASVCRAEVEYREARRQFC